MTVQGGLCEISRECAHFRTPCRTWRAVNRRGHVKGDSLLEMGAAGMVFPLFSASNVFKNIYVMDTTNTSVRHIKKWLEKGDEATDWSHAAKLTCELEGNADGWQEKEEQVRRAVKGVFRYNLSDEGSKESVPIPKVDCVLMVYFLNGVCRTKEDFKVNLKTFTSWLKVGGYLVFFIALNMTFFKIGDHKFSTLAVNEKFVRKAINNAGFVIEKDKIIPTSVESDNVDYEDLHFIVARKVKDA
ncbi:nicotinamide N-methyltransferase-like [Hyla sarda]|uniref:nicotinamide N-methyltransferase-like n=1 Tax=Hyla sarda TaxID=327740 RepID=UPI0024C256F2|nr:nicotinamide N-methyltransferase-like [Hyla sarda]